MKLTFLRIFVEFMMSGEKGKMKIRIIFVVIEKALREMNVQTSVDFFALEMKCFRHQSIDRRSFFFFF